MINIQNFINKSHYISISDQLTVLNEGLQFLGGKGS